MAMETMSGGGGGNRSELLFIHGCSLDFPCIVAIILVRFSAGIVFHACTDTSNSFFFKFFT
jgi:hypothetical protein